MKKNNIKITSEQKPVAKNWIKKKQVGELKSETENYEKCRDEILVKILGYDEKEVEITHGGKGPDYIILPYTEMCGAEKTSKIVYRSKRNFT